MIATLPDDDRVFGNSPGRVCPTGRSVRTRSSGRLPDFGSPTATRMRPRRARVENPVGARPLRVVPESGCPRGFMRDHADVAPRLDRLLMGQIQLHRRSV
jgi:hypothetical protein